MFVRVQFWDDCILDAARIGAQPRPPTVQAWVYNAVRLMNSFIYFSN